MKIVLGTHHYPPTYVAGVELITQRIAGWLRDHGHSVEVVCVESISSDVHGQVTTDVQDGITVHRIGLKLWGIGEHLGLRFRDDVLGRWFSAYLASSRPDVFHSHSSYLLTASLIEAANQNQIPVVATLHDFWFMCPRITLLRSDGEVCGGSATPEDCARCIMRQRGRYRLIDDVAAKLGKSVSCATLLRPPLDGGLVARIEDRQTYLDSLLRSIDQIISPAELARELLVNRGFTPEQVRLIRYGLDLSMWHDVQRSARTAGPRIGYMGQLAPHKGVHVLIEAFRGLTAARDGAPELRIFGDPSRIPQYSDKLRAIADGDERIVFMGAYGNEKTADILANLDALVVPSVWYETSPLVIMEAFAAGVPVIASRLGNLQYQVRDEVDGLQFAPADAADLRRQLQRLVDNPELPLRLARGISPVRTLGEEMAELEDVYRSVAARRQTYWQSVLNHRSTLSDYAPVAHA